MASIKTIANLIEMNTNADEMTFNLAVCDLASSIIAIGRPNKNGFMWLLGH